jgi:hypothetical protein
MIRLTAACPPHLIEAMNAYAAASTGDPSNALSFGPPQWTDGPAVYSAASWLASEGWVDAALAALTAQGIPHVVWTGDGPAPLAAPDRLTVHAGPAGLAAMAAMGLAIIEVAV